MSPHTEQRWSGFQPGQRVDPGLQPGTYPAYLRPDIRQIPTEYGTALKIYYNVFLRGRDAWRSYQMSELCPPRYTLGSKFTSRVAAATGAVTESEDLSQRDIQGWVLVTIERDQKDPRFMKIADVIPIPRDFAIPDVPNPEAVQTTFAPTRPEDSYTVSPGFDTDDVPF